VLTAIRPDRKAIETKTFRPESEAALLSWLKRLNGNHNLYWSTNPPMRDLSKKAEREDIKEVAYLHVDIDPHAGEDVEAEGARILALFNGKLPEALRRSNRAALRFVIPYASSCCFSAHSRTSRRLVSIPDSNEGS
jgi:hypothetical protein